MKLRKMVIDIYFIGFWMWKVKLGYLWVRVILMIKGVIINWSNVYSMLVGCNWRFLDKDEVLGMYWESN